MTIAFGPWEKYFLLRLAAGGGVGTSVLIELDRPLDLGRVEQALSAIRPGFPLFFSRLTVDAGRPARVLAVSDVDADIGSFIRRADADVAPKDYFRAVLSKPLDPFADGLFRLHCGGGSRPFVGFQLSHLCGDARTFGACRRAFAAALAGDTAPLVAPFASIGPHQLRQRLPSAWPVAWPSARTLFRHRQAPALAYAHDDPRADPPEWRVVRAALNAAAARDVIRRSLAARVSPLAYLGGCLAVAVDRCYDPWHSRPGDYFAINVPIDVRPWFDLRGRAGNLIYPVGIPMTLDDVASVERAAQAVAGRFDAGRRTFLAFQEVARALTRADETPIEQSTMSFTGHPPDGVDRRTVDPLEILGVTELGARAPFERLGDAAIIDYILQSPILVRRPFAGGSELTFTIAWYPSLERRLRAFVGTLLAAIATGEAAPDAAPSWELV